MADDAVDDQVDVTAQPLYSSVDGVGPEHGVDWQIDAPWRMEPTSSSDHTYDPIPITITFDDAGQQFGPSKLPLNRFCGAYVMEKQPAQAIQAASVTMVPPTAFHEIEGSKAWLDTGILTPGPNNHLLRRMWNGDSPEDVINVSDWTEWTGTILYTPRRGTPVNDDLDLIVFARVSESGVCSDVPLTAGQLLYQLKQGRSTELQTWPASPNSLMFADALRVHYSGDALPRFSNDWVYGDLHYHSQGTDNEGESGVAYRAVILAMKAMGLDYAFATEHASSSAQITGAKSIFLDQPPHFSSDIYNAIAQFVYDNVDELKTPLPLLPQSAALRDMSPERFAYLIHWLHDFNGVDQEIAYAGGSGRLPQLFLGGEVNAIPEMSADDARWGGFEYGNGLFFDVLAACDDIPPLFGDVFGLVENTTFEQQCKTSMIMPGSSADRRAIRDVQGPAQVNYYARQHMVYLPSDPNRTDAFVASNTSAYGGATRYLSEIIDDDLTAQNKGYVFLAHPVAAALGKDIGRFGPDIVPYSKAQLQTAFASPRVLGLQLWNEDERFHTDSEEKGSFPFLYNQGVEDPDFPGTVNNVSLGWQFAHFDPIKQVPSLVHGSYMWDSVLLWGINPSKTSNLGWLKNGGPRKFFMAGGSDAHGDINYRREGQIVGWSRAVNTAIGKPRNLTFVGSARPGSAGGRQTIAQGQVLDALEAGHFMVTDGPILRIALDNNNNGIIDDGDTQMGGDTTIFTTSQVPLLVEWKSTPEFGPVKLIDLYLGVQGGTRDGMLYAAAGHGPGGNGTCLEAPTAIRDASGKTYCPMADNYVRDPSGKLHIVPTSSEGYHGIRKIYLNPNDYSLFDYSCQTTTKDLGGVDGTIRIKTCTASNVLAPDRLFIRAFAQSNDYQHQGAARYAFTNPIWVARKAPIVIGVPRPSIGFGRSL